MAAPGGELRVRLMFDYPPPAVPQSRQLWCMLDTERCRAVTDVSAIIRERFYYGRRGALSLYLDKCLLPPGESVRLIRDSETLSVKWEQTGPHNSPHRTSKKRQRSEDESDDCWELKTRRDVYRGYSKKTKKGVVTSEEEEVSERPKKKNKAEVFPEEEVRERPKKKVVVTAEKVHDGSKKKKVVVTPEEEVRKRPKKNKGEMILEEVNQRPKKNKGEMIPEEVNKRPKKNKGEMIPEELNQRPKKNKGEMIPEEVGEHPKKGVVNPDVNERPKKNKGMVTPEEVSEQSKKQKARSPPQDSGRSAEAPERRPKKHDFSKKPPHVDHYQGESRSTVQNEAPQLLNSTTARKETSSSSSSDQEDTGWNRRGKPGPSSNTQQREGSSSPDGFTIKNPPMSGLAASPPVYNGHVARVGAQHRPLLKTAEYGVGRGRGIENLPWRGRGFRGRGKTQPQNHYFYNYSPEALKQQHLNEDASNVSVLIQNPPEVVKRDYSALPLLAAAPQPGNTIAFKLLELTDNYTPEVSDYKEGRVLGYDPLSQQLEVEILSQQKKKGPGKFDLIYEQEDGKNVVEYAVPQEYKITQAWSSLIEPRLVTEQRPVAAVQGD